MRKALAIASWPFLTAGIMALALVLSVVLSPVYAWTICKAGFVKKAKVAAAAILIATGANAQWDIKPLPPDSAHLCLTYMRGFGQYTHPAIGPFEVGIFRDERGNFWTVRIAPGAKPKEGDEFTVTNSAIL